MTNKRYDYAVYVGRFQPFHSGHAHIVREALKVAGKVILIVGSTDKPRDVRNPFTYGQRVEIIHAALSDVFKERLKVVPQVDYTYNDEKWIASIQGAVSAITNEGGWTDMPKKICIVGYEKDHSTYYMKKFPLWDVLEIEPINSVNATDVRNFLFSGHEGHLNWKVNQEHLNEVLRACRAAEKDGILDEFRIIQEYKKSWERAPYPVTFQTVDAVVTQSGHILLVLRKDAPGKGLWALPGGFILPTEKLIDAMLRELEEETKLKVPKPVLVGSIVKTHTYDDPYRSARGRTITQAYHIKLADQEKLPKVKGSDDARKAKWFPLSEFMKMRSSLFEDHMAIVEHMLGL